MTSEFPNIILQSLRLYPNPTHDQITIEYGNTMDQATISLYNLLGSLLLSREARGQSRIALDLSEYPAGIYILSFQTGTSQRIYKVIKK